MPEYTHTLIPEQLKFVPESNQIVAFLSAVVTSGAAPLQPMMMVAKPTGDVRTVNNPATGESLSFVMRTGKKVKDFAALSRAILSLDDYDITIAGKGPPALPAFTFQFKGQYDFAVHCSLRPTLVSTSDWHDHVPIKRKVKLFGQPCGPKDRLGLFHNPDTLEVIEVPKAGCARFWISFEFGKSFFPPINDRLDLIEPAFVEIARKEFGVNFVQGCQWCA
jgi:hypothetical protein